MRFDAIRECPEATSQTEVRAAKALGIRQSFLSEIENGGKRPGPRLAAKIEAATGIPLKKLLLGKAGGAGKASGQRKGSG